jgi:hypothetical protein
MARNAAVAKAQREKFIEAARRVAASEIVPGSEPREIASKEPDMAASRLSKSE